MGLCSAFTHLEKQFEEYITGALASIKHADFIAKGVNNDVVIEGKSSRPSFTVDPVLIFT